jgi:translation initiation factor IF-2
MSEQTESMKVYELAKELGMDSFSLLDKLKEINVDVKNHMSSLDATQMQTVRAHLTKKEAKSGAAKVVRRGAAGASAAKEAPAAAASPTAETPKRKVIKAASPTAAAGATVAKEAKSTAAPKAAAPAKETAAESASAAGKRKIIKRRTAEDGTETVTGVPPRQVNPESEAADGSSASASQADSTQQEMAAEPAPAPIKREEYVPRENAPGTRASLKTPSIRPVEKDELMEEFTSRKLKIVQQAPPGGVRTKDNEVTYKSPGARAPTERKETSTTVSKSTADSGMFTPYTSVLNKEDEEKRRRGGGGAAHKAIEEVKISDFSKREMVFQPKRKKLPPGKLIKRTEITTPSAQKRKIRIEDKIIVSDLAQRMGEKTSTILAKLMSLGTMVNQNQAIDFDTATLIANEFDYEVENIAFNESKVLGAASTEVDEKAVPRPPVITVMGHVDHGKTSLLDAIRNANVVSGEAGGITQHIGAYSVDVGGKKLTFLDTPGHEAFANMRARGANITDIVVLVVAADDSIMPQTKEAINHAVTAKVPMIVAANKMDKPSANIEKLKQDLSANNVLVEDWGGEVPLMPISALKKTGLKELLDTIAVHAEVLDLKANPDVPAEGAVLEARMEKGRGVVADLLVRKGTLRAGDAIVVGTAYGRVRAMMNDRGESVKEVLPGYPVEIFGLNEVPTAGDTFYITKNEAEAKQVADNRRAKILEQKSIDLAPKPMSLDDLMSKLPVAGMKELNIIVKTDVYGSAEAIKESIGKIESNKVKAKVIACNVGVITENDVLMAKTANAKIYGFNSKPDSKARDLAKREGVEVKFQTIIYELLDDVRASMEALLEPLKIEHYIGRAEVKQAFTVSKIGLIAGSMVVDGKITRNSFGRVKRGKDIAHEGKIVGLKRFKDDASETIKGQECGIGIQGYTDIQSGDVIEAFNVEFVKQKL